MDDFLRKKKQWLVDQSGTELMFFVYHGIKRQVRKLLESCGVNDCIPGGPTALWFALESNNEEMVELLLAHGADVSADPHEPGSHPHLR